MAGHFNGTVKGIDATWYISGPVQNDTWIIEHIRTAPTVKSMHLYLDNFFEGNREFSK